jgi:predicted RNA-binding protein with RPS1 domain
LGTNPLIRKNKYFTLSFCQFLINDKLNNNERANYLLGKILRQLFYSTFDISFKEKLLFSAYYYQSNQFQQNAHPFKFTEKLEIIEDNLPENPNCCQGNNDNWILIKDSYDKKSVIEVKAIKKEFNGFVVDYKGIKGFLPFNHITENSLKYYSYSKVDFTLTVYCILISEEFNFFVAKQPYRNTQEYICSNNLLGQIKVGDIVEGKVKSVEKYGVFITSYWGDGLLHIKNISTHFWDKERLHTYFSKGDLITTKVINIEGNKIALSYIDLIDTEEEDKYFDFINYVDFGDVFTSNNYDSDASLIIDDEEVKYNQLEKAFCFEQYAMLKKSLDEKIHYLRLSKQFFSSINNSRSYLINIYTNYFELLKLIEEVINDFSIEKIERIKSEALIVNEKVKSQEQTLEIFPDSKKLIFFINIISLFNDTSESGIHSLYELLQKNSNQKVLKTIAKITLANNLLISESEENSDFVRKNLRHIKAYLDDGVLSLKETESDRLERELKEKVKYWSDRIQEDESETQEFKSTFFTPVPDEAKQKEKAKLVEILNKTDKKDGLLKKIDAIDGKLASKAVIHSSLKTLCAFANTNGGTLIIGISDNKSTVGLEVDYKNLKGKKNRDGFGLFFDQKIKEYFEPSFSSLLERDFLKFPDGDILIVSVKQSVEPVFLLKDEEPYTLPSRSKSRRTDQNLSKSMAAQTHGQTAENKARKHNTVYKTFGGKC